MLDLYELAASQTTGPRVAGGRARDRHDAWSLELTARPRVDERYRAPALSSIREMLDSHFPPYSPFSARERGQGVRDRAPRTVWTLDGRASSSLSRTKSHRQLEQPRERVSGIVPGADHVFLLLGALDQFFPHAGGGLAQDEARLADSALWLRLLSARAQGLRVPRDRPSYAQLLKRPEERVPEAMLCAVPGVSVGMARALLGRFGSVSGVARASEDELLSVAGVGPVRAKALQLALH